MHQPLPRPPQWEGGREGGREGGLDFRTIEMRTLRKAGSSLLSTHRPYFPIDVHSSEMFESLVHVCLK